MCLLDVKRAAARAAAVALVVAPTACWDAPTATLGPTPVVSLILAEGESLQVASVTLTTPGDSSFPSEPVSVPAEQVGLRVEDDSGNAWPLTFTGAPGKFSAAMSPRRGVRYRLMGTVVERAIAAETRVPAVFTLLEPAGDTVTAADIVPCQHFEIPGKVCVRLVVAFDGPGSVYCQVQDQASPFIQYCYFRGTTAELRIDRADRIRDVVFSASNGGAYGWLALPDSRGNVAGAFGGFSAILTFRRKVYIP